MSESSAFMNQLIRGEVQQDTQGGEGESDEPASVGGKSDGGAGQEREPTGSRDMNAWLRDAVFESGNGRA